MDLVQMIVSGLIVATSLVIISRVPFLGIDIDSYPKALITAGVFGILNALLLPILKLFFAIPNLVTFGLLSSIFAFFMNVVIFAIAASLVKGFDLRQGLWSAVGGALALSVVNSLVSSFVYGLA